VVRDRGLGQADRRCDVARADGSVRGQLAYDRQPSGIGEGSEKPHVGIVDAYHAPSLSINFYIDNGRYIG
jgi:hypothetical protein